MKLSAPVQLLMGISAWWLLQALAALVFENNTRMVMLILLLSLIIPGIFLITIKRRLPYLTPISRTDKIVLFIANVSGYIMLLTPLVAPFLRK